MSALSDQERMVVARHVLALRRHGMPTGAALALTAEGLPPGDARDELKRIAGALNRGEPVEVGPEPLAALLARGEALSNDALEEAARGFALATESQLVPAVRFVHVAIAGALLFFAAFVFLVGPVFAKMFRGFGAALPAPTQFLIDARGWLPELLLVVAALVIAGGEIFFRHTDGWGGANKLKTARDLRIVAAALASGFDESAALAQIDPARPATLAQAACLRSDPFAVRCAQHLSATDGPRIAASVLAGELERDGRARATSFGLWGPALVLLFAGWLVGVGIIALYLPIFAF